MQEEALLLHKNLSSNLSLHECELLTEWGKPLVYMTQATSAESSLLDVFAYRLAGNFQGLRLYTFAFVLLHTFNKFMPRISRVDLGPLVFSGGNGVSPEAAIIPSRPTRDDGISAIVTFLEDEFGPNDMSARAWTIKGLWTSRSAHRLIESVEIAFNDGSTTTRHFEIPLNGVASNTIQRMLGS